MNPNKNLRFISTTSIFPFFELWAFHWNIIFESDSINLLFLFVNNNKKYGNMHQFLSLKLVAQLVYINSNISCLKFRLCLTTIVTQSIMILKNLLTEASAEMLGIFVMLVSSKIWKLIECFYLSICCFKSFQMFWSDTVA